MWLLFLYFSGLYTFGYTRSISPSEREAIWNNFKYRNAFIRWTMVGPNSTGVVIQGDDLDYLEPVFQIKVSRHNMITVILPYKDGSTALLSAQIPRTDYPFEIILTVGQDLLVATSKCHTIMLDRIKEVDFKIRTPEITLGSLPHFYENIHVSSGNPLPAFCSVLLNQEVPTVKETVENKKRAGLSNVRVEEDRNITCKHLEQEYRVGALVEKSECEWCTCLENGSLACEHRGCLPIPNCDYPIHEPGSCCPTRCAKECEFNGVSHHHGSIFWPETCVRCACDDGSVHCKFNHVHMCPNLPCPLEQQKKEIGQCCPSCVNFDYCSVNPCHTDATCFSSNEGAKCRCKEGFFGNGTYCYDIDECNFAWSVQEQLGGCTGSVCINTKGGFRCDCLPGHPRIDERTCLNLIRI